MPRIIPRQHRLVLVATKVPAAHAHVLTVVAGERGVSALLRELVGRYVADRDLQVNRTSVSAKPPYPERAKDLSMNRICPEDERPHGE